MGMLAAKQPLVVPMLLRLSHFKLNSYVVLVVSKQKGITLVFKTDPLQNVDITSTFDSIAVIQKFIQREIEGQLRQMFKEDLPGIIHRLSQQWVKAKVEAPYLDKKKTQSRPSTAASSAGLSYATAPSSPHRLSPLPRPLPWSSSTGRSHSYSAAPSTGTLRTSTERRSSPSSSSPSYESPSSFPDLEHYDPTYGLRSDGGSSKKTFGGYSRLFARTKGLADLAEESRERPSPAGSIDDTNWDDSISDVGSFLLSATDPPGYETVPAVGGGTVTRPRIIHSQSHAPSGLSASSQSPEHIFMRGPLSSNTGLYRPHALDGFTPISPSKPLSAFHRSASVLSNPYFPRIPPTSSPLRPVSTHAGGISRQGLRDRDHPSTPPLHRATPSAGSPGHGTASHSRSSSGMVPTPPSSDVAPGDDTIRTKHMRRPSLSSVDFFSDSPSDHLHVHDPGPTRIVLRPALNNSVSQLSILTHSNHTLSPFTRSMEHFTVRSVPPRAPLSSGLPSAVERQPTKARRKRIHRLGATKRTTADQPAMPILPPPSECGASEMHHYFRDRDEGVPLLRLPRPRNHGL